MESKGMAYLQRYSLICSLAAFVAAGCGPGSAASCTTLEITFDHLATKAKSCPALQQTAFAASKCERAMSQCSTSDVTALDQISTCYANSVVQCTPGYESAF